MTTLEQIKAWASEGESAALEFKRSTGELRQALETLCGFLNASGGRVLIGVNHEGHVLGQQVSEQTLHDVTDRFKMFEPPAVIQTQRVPFREGREVIVLSVQASQESVPYTFAGRAYERVGNTTRAMSQKRYETLLLDRAHSKRRWENLPADGASLADLDHEEILRTREAAVRQRRISPETSADIEDILSRLGLIKDSVLTRAALVLYGKRLMSDYPQSLLKLGRFRGTTITGDIVDNRQEHLNAFAMVREGMAFLDRTLPLSARFPEGKIFREDRLPIPPSALREILLNAVMHRDYSDPGGSVGIAVFDDRVEIRSVGSLPTGMTVEMLSRPHLSKLRNPLIADAFHRTGAVEIWGRGTDRVIAECKAYGIAAPTFEDWNGALVVAFQVPIVTPQVPRKYPASTPQVTSQIRSLLTAARKPRSRDELQESIGMQDREHFRKALLHPLLAAGWIERTIPDKPLSSRQKYRMTPAGKAALRRA